MSTELETERNASLAKYKAACKAAKVVFLASKGRAVDRKVYRDARGAAETVWHAEMASFDHPAKAAVAVKAAPPASDNDG